MSAEPRQITLTETADGHWRAQAEPDGISRSGDTIVEALAELADARTEPIDGALTAIDALADADIDRILEVHDALDKTDDGATDIEDVDPDAPLFTGKPFIDNPLGDESIDDVLYGPIETDEGSEIGGDT